MACPFGMTLIGEDPVWLQRAADDAFAEIARVESLLNMYDPDSTLSAINRAAASGPVVVDEEVFELLLVAGTIWEQTGGAFDPTMGPLVRLWRLWRTNGLAPDADAIETVRQRVGMEHVAVDVSRRTIQFTRPGMEIDLGAIGKGYGVDQAMEALIQYDVEHCLVHAATSTIAARGSMDDTTDGWGIGVTDPVNREEVAEVITLHDEACSCSNQQNQYYQHGGRELGHVIDPRTGWPASAESSMLVVSMSATQADALSTASLVLGDAAARALAQSLSGVRVMCLSRGAEPSAGGVDKRKVSGSDR